MSILGYEPKTIRVIPGTVWTQLFQELSSDQQIKAREKFSSAQGYQFGVLQLSVAALEHLFGNNYVERCGKAQYQVLGQGPVMQFVALDQSHDKEQATVYTPSGLTEKAKKELSGAEPDQWPVIIAAIIIELKRRFKKSPKKDIESREHKLLVELENYTAALRNAMAITTSPAVQANNTTVADQDHDSFWYLSL